MKNKFGREVKVIDLGTIYKDVIDAEIRHLKNVRLRYLDYVIKMNSPSDRVIINAILAEKIYKQARKEENKMVKELTPEEQRRQKIQTIKNLRERYRRMEQEENLSRNVRVHLGVRRMELQMAQDRLEGIAR